MLAKSAWNHDEISDYLDKAAIPLRLACQDDAGFPLICSLWFMPSAGKLLCATHENSRVAKLLLLNPKVAFEIAPNEQPYSGVRGKGVAKLTRHNAKGVLKNLIARYLDHHNEPLATWLLTRVKREYVIEIDIVKITSWDYSDRMYSKVE